MSTTSTKFLFQLADPTDVFDNDKYLKGNFQIIEGQVYTKAEVDALFIKGSNANGDYIKFPDGTMICTMQKTVTDQAVTSAYGSLFSGSRTWTFPATFIAPPSVAVGEFNWGTSASWGMSLTSTSTSSTLQIIDVSSRASGTSTTVKTIAIGKWK